MRRAVTVRGMNRCRRCGATLTFFGITLVQGWRRWDLCSACNLYWWMDDNRAVGVTVTEPPIPRAVHRERH